MSMSFFCYDEFENFVFKDHEILEEIDGEPNPAYYPSFVFETDNSMAMTIAQELNHNSNIEDCAIDMPIDEFITKADEYVIKARKEHFTFTAFRLAQMLYIAKECKTRGAVRVILF